MSQVTITYGGASKTVDRAIAESQVVKAEAAIAQLRERMAVRHADKRFSAHADADARTAADIARYESIAAACRAALA